MTVHVPPRSPASLSANPRSARLEPSHPPHHFPLHPNSLSHPSKPSPSLDPPSSTLQSTVPSPLSSPPSTLPPTTTAIKPASASQPNTQLTRPGPHSRSTQPPRGTVYVVERFSRFSRLLYANNGSPLLPIVDRVIAAFSTRRVDLSTPSQGLDTLLPNGRRFAVHATWSLTIIDPKSLAYSHPYADVDGFARMVVHCRLRDVLAERRDSPILQSSNPTPTADLSEAVRFAVNKTMVKHGLTCPSFTIVSLRPTLDSTSGPRNRSLNLAHTSDSSYIPTHEADSVLPELPLPPDAPAANARLHPHMIHPVPPLSPMPPSHRSPHTRHHAFPHAFPPLPQSSIPPQMLHVSHPVPTLSLASHHSPHPHLFHPPHLMQPLAQSRPPFVSFPHHPPHHSSRRQNPKTHTPKRPPLPHAPVPVPPLAHSLIPSSVPKYQPTLPPVKQNALPRYPQPPPLPKPSQNIRSNPPPPVLRHNPQPHSVPNHDHASDFSDAHTQSTQHGELRPEPEWSSDFQSDPVLQPPRAQTPRKPLYAPPPSPALKLAQNSPVSSPMLPMLVSKALSADPLPLEPRLGPVLFPQSPDRRITLPAPSTESSPTLARHLHTLPQTPYTEIPSSDTGSETPVDVNAEEDQIPSFKPSLKAFESDSRLSRHCDDFDDQSDPDISALPTPHELADSYEQAVQALIARSSIVPSALADLSPSVSLDHLRAPHVLAEDVIRGMDADDDDVDDEPEEFDGAGAVDHLHGIDMAHPLVGPVECFNFDGHLDGMNDDVDDDLGDGPDDDGPLLSVDRKLSPLAPPRKSSLELAHQRHLYTPSSPMSVDDRISKVNDSDSLLEVGTRRVSSLSSLPDHRGYFGVESVGSIDSAGVKSSSALIPEDEDRSIRKAADHLGGPVRHLESIPRVGLHRKLQNDLSKDTSALARAARARLVEDLGPQDPYSGIPGSHYGYNAPAGDHGINASGARNWNTHVNGSKPIDGKATPVQDDSDKGQKSPTEGLVLDVSSEDGSTDMWANGNSDAEREKFGGEALSRISSMSRRQSSRDRHGGSRSRKRSEGDEGDTEDYHDMSSDEEFCEECDFHRQYDSYKYAGSHRHRGRTRSRRRGSAEFDRGEIVDDTASLEHKNSGSARSRSRSRKGDKSNESRKVDNGKERSHGRKKLSVSKASKDKESTLKTRNGERKRNHSRSSSASKKRDGGDSGEKPKKEGRGKSRGRHRKGGAPARSNGVDGTALSQNAIKVKSIYRHRLPESDSGPENPIPWYCEGQSEPEDTDSEDFPRHLYEGDQRVRAVQGSGDKFYSSYGRRDRYGRKHRAQHNRTVTFLYDNQ